MIDDSRKLSLMEDPGHGFESDAPHNTGTMLIGSPCSPSEPRTIVVAGLPRGGTTMTAICLSAMGLYLGTPPYPPRHFFEDPRFAALLHMEEPGKVDVPRLRALIQRRNEEYPVWGFKFPLAINSLPILEQELRNPHFILVFRDVVAAASREKMAVGMDALYAMRRGLVLQSRMIEFAEASKAPCMLLSYEKTLQFPAEVVDLMAQWCGLHPTAEQVEEARTSIRANSPIYISREDPTLDFATV